MKKFLCTGVLAMFFAVTVNAQMSSNVQVGFLNTLGTGSYRSIGLGGGLQRAFTARLMIGFSANIYFGGKANLTDTAFAYSTGTDPQYVLVDITRKAITYTGNLDFRFYVVGDAESDMGVYGLAGLGVVKWAIRTKEIGQYDDLSYGFQTTPVINDLSTGAAFGPAFGAGFEKNVGNMYFCTNARFTLPVLGESDPGSGFEKPKTIILEAGLRFPF
jgi:hypothetical protein